MKKFLKVFGITTLILLLSFLLLGIYPFGNKSIVVIDSNTQYVAFLSYLRSILLGNNDFKYTLSATLGENFIPLLGYYLMSIFNLLVVFFKVENIKILFTILVILKIGLCSVSMEYYLEKKYKKNTVLFSVCYGLMAYNIVYMYHIMWFDSIILFPLVILGIDKTFEDKSPLLYIVSLGCAIIFNYYIGFIICLTSVLYFVYKFLFCYKRINKFKVVVNYGFSSLLAGLLSSFILLPSVLGLLNGKVGSGINFGFNLSYLNVIAKSFTASLGSGETWHGGPMIASSMFIFILVIFYFFNKKISFKEKIINGISLFFLMSSFVFKPLNLVFHGFTDPNCFNYRHAFVFVFFVICLAIRSYNKLELNENIIKKVKWTSFILIIFVLFARFKFNVSTYNFSIFISLLLVIVYLFLLSKKRNVFYVVLLDLFINVMAGLIMITNSDKQFMSDYKKYVNDVSSAVDSIRDDGLYRVEKVFDREKNDSMLAINDSMIFGYNGISHFDSTSSVSVENLFEKLGQRRLLTRAYYSKNSTYFIDSLFGVKYILSYDNYKNYDLINSKNSIGIYENPYYLSFGYKILSDASSFGNNPFVNQNSVLKSFSGLDKDVYIQSSYVMQKESSSINISVEVIRNDNLYLYVPNPDIFNYPNVKVYINDEFYCKYLTKYNWSTLDLGKYDIGSTINIRLEVDDENIDDVYLYYEDLDVFEEHYNILKNNQVNFRKVSSSYIVGDINLDDDSKILISLPYDEGWNIYVNDESVVVNKSLDSLISIDLNKGANVIELKYEPKGLKLGIYLSLFSLFLTTIYVIFRKKIWMIYDKFKEIFNYIIVGVLTTVVSLVSYFILSRILDIDKTVYFLLANTFSWILSVLFAYITNKNFVFNSKSLGEEGVKEFIKFISSRILTYLIDIALMFIFVKLIGMNNDISKLIIQFIVLFLNYIFSKLLVFAS